MSALNLERSGVESIGRARGLLEDMVAYARRPSFTADRCSTLPGFAAGWRRCR